MRDALTPHLVDKALEAIETAGTEGALRKVLDRTIVQVNRHKVRRARAHLFSTLKQVPTDQGRMKLSPEALGDLRDLFKGWRTSSLGFPQLEEKVEDRATLRSLTTDATLEELVSMTRVAGATISANFDANMLRGTRRWTKTQNTIKQVHNEIVQSKVRTKPKDTANVIERMMSGASAVPAARRRGNLSYYFREAIVTLKTIMDDVSPTLRTIAYDDLMDGLEKEKASVQKHRDMMNRAYAAAWGHDVGTGKFEKTRTELVTAQIGDHEVEMQRDELVELLAASLDPENIKALAEHGFKVERLGESASTYHLHDGDVENAVADTLAAVQDLRAQFPTEHKLAAKLFDIRNKSMRPERNAQWLDVFGYEVDGDEDQYYVRRSHEVEFTDPLLRLGDPKDDLGIRPSERLKASGQLPSYRPPRPPDAPLLISPAAFTFQAEAAQTGRIQGYLAPMWNIKQVMSNREVDKALHHHLGERSVKTMMDGIQQQVASRPPATRLDTVLTNWGGGTLALRLGPMLFTVASLPYVPATLYKLGFGPKRGDRIYSACGRQDVESVRGPAHEERRLGALVGVARPL